MPETLWNCRVKQFGPLIVSIAVSYTHLDVYKRQVLDHEKIDDCIDTIKDYADDSIPVLSKDKHILGVITSDDIVEMVDNEMGEDVYKRQVLNKYCREYTNL